MRLSARKLTGDFGPKIFRQNGGLTRLSTTRTQAREARALKGYTQYSVGQYTVPELKYQGH